MSCECENTSCLNLFVSPCSPSVDTGLIANITGTWIAIYEFNGTSRQQTLEFTANDHIILLNQFNGNYKHLLRIYKPDGTLFNNMCYTMDITLVLDGNNGAPAPLAEETITTNITYVFKDNPDPTAGNGSQASPYELQSGASITIPLFINKIVHEPQAYNTGLEYLIFSKNSLGKAIDALFTRTFNNDFNQNDIITFSYEA